MPTNIECKICGNGENNNYLTATEMMFRMGDGFTYLNCSKCGCLSLLTLAKDVSIYHQSKYFSLAYRQKGEEKLKKLKNIIRRSAMKRKLGGNNILDIICSKIKKSSYSWVKKGLARLDSKILTVGCNSGPIAEDMKNYGFTDLTVSDPCSSGTIESDNYKKYKSDIDSLQQGDFDLIMYHHSFEQIADPHEELQSIYQKLTNEGTLLIRTSVCDSYAFRKYKQEWVHLNAPRNAFLHTTKSIQELAEKNGFYIDDIIYDSSIVQFTVSECYRRGLPICASNKIFGKEQLDEFARKTKELNLINDGDSTCFYLKKKIVETV